ncbi:MAG: hypothetical protein WC959_05470 [Kiritimatiellales bacterium]
MCAAFSAAGILAGIYHPAGSTASSVITNGTVVGSLTVTPELIGIPTTVSGAPDPVYDGEYNIFTTMNYIGEVFTNANGKFMFYDIECLADGNWLISDDFPVVYDYENWPSASYGYVYYYGVDKVTWQIIGWNNSSYQHIDGMSWTGKPDIIEPGGAVVARYGKFLKIQTGDHSYQDNPQRDGGIIRFDPQLLQDSTINYGALTNGNIAFPGHIALVTHTDLGHRWWRGTLNLPEASHGTHGTIGIKPFWGANVTVKHWPQSGYYFYSAGGNKNHTFNYQADASTVILQSHNNNANFGNTNGADSITGSYVVFLGRQFYPMNSTNVSFDTQGDIKNSLVSLWNNANVVIVRGNIENSIIAVDGLSNSVPIQGSVLAGKNHQVNHTHIVMAGDNKTSVRDNAVHTDELVLFNQANPDQYGRMWFSNDVLYVRTPDGTVKEAQLINP